MGSGSIEERKGRFRVRLRVSGAKRTIGTCATREEAERVLAAALDALEAKRLASPGSITLRDWIARWLEQRELSGVVRSSYDDASRLRAHVLSAPWADDPLDALDRRVLRDWVIGLLRTVGRRHAGNGDLVETGRALSRHTVSHVLATLRVCLRDAVEAGLIDDNPAAGIRVPAQQYTHEPWTYLTQEEIEQVLACEKIPEAYRLIYTVAIYTGLRKGELWGLRWGDVYDDHATPHLMVRRSYKQAPKNGKIRCVPLLARAREAFVRLRALAEQDLDAGAELAAEALVFPSSTGMRGKENSAGWAVRKKRYELVSGERKLCEVSAFPRLAGLTRHVRFHDLRHTCASHLVMGTWGRPWRLEEVRDFLGHSDVGVTQRYAHLSPGMLHAAAAATLVAASSSDGATIIAGPKVAPLENLEAEDAARNVVQMLEILRSHLRELNPGPTVYESQLNVNGHASLDAVGANVGTVHRARAVELLRATYAGAPLDVDAARRLAAAALLAALEAPACRAAQDLLEAADDRVAVTRAIGFASLLLLPEEAQAGSGEGRTG